MNPRILLWVGLLFVAYLNFDAWMKDYAPAAARESARECASGRDDGEPAGRTLGGTAGDRG